MKINSETLFEFINNLGTNEKVKFKVYYDDNYVTEIYWDGENFNWEPGTFNSGAFFNPLYDFEEILEDKPKKVEQIMTKKAKYDDINELVQEVFKAFETINDLSIAVNYLLEKSDKDV